MRYGIPGFRTPREVLDAEIQRILDLGVKTRLKCRVGSDVTMERSAQEFDAVFLGLGAQAGRALPIPGAGNDAANVVTATSFLKAFNDGRLQHVGKRVVVVGGGDTSIDVATVARRLGHIEQQRSRPTRAVIGGRPPTTWPRSPPSARARGDADLGVRHRQDAGQQARDRAGPRRRHRDPRRPGAGGMVRGPTAAPPRCAWRAARPSSSAEARDQDDRRQRGGHPGRPHRLGHRPGGGLHRPRGVQQPARVPSPPTATTRCKGKPGVFAGGDVLRPHLLTTAIGHGAIAADGIDRFLRRRGTRKAPEDRRACLRPEAQDGREGPADQRSARSRCTAPTAAQRCDAQLRQPLRPLRHPARGALPRPLRLHAAQHAARRHHAEQGKALATSRSAWMRSRGPGRGRGQALHELRQCFECDNCVVYCPQTAVFRVPKKEASTGRYVATPTTTSASAATSATTSARPATSRWASASDARG
jgi:Pyruvate/2-oxoacid:ferredoxin oxidoreductase delta subunit